MQLRDFLVEVLTPTCKECGAVNVPLQNGLCEPCEEADASDREEARYFDQSYLEPVAHPEQYFHGDRRDDPSSDVVSEIGNDPYTDATDQELLNEFDPPWVVE